MDDNSIFIPNIMVQGSGNFIYDYKGSVKLWELRTTGLGDTEWSGLGWVGLGWVGLG